MAKLRVDKIASVGVSTETTGSVFFDGSGDRLIIPTSTDLNLTGDFTIEYWVYINSVDSINYISFFSTSSGGNYSAETAIFWGASEDYFGFQNKGTTLVTATMADPTNAWYHIAVTRSGSTTRMFLNGKQTGSTTTSWDAVTGQSWYIGDRPPGATSGNYPLNGYISNFRICKGHAVYTSDFAPPTRELEVHPETVLLACYDGENIFADKSGRHIIAAYGDRTSSPTPAQTDSPIGITTFQPGLDRDVDNTFGPTFQGGAGYASQNWLTLPKGTTTDRNRTGGRAVFGGGTSTGSNNLNSIEFISITTQGNGQDFGDLITAARTKSGGGVSSPTRAVTAGGFTSSTDNEIEFFTIASTGNTVDFGADLTSNARNLGQASNSTRGLFAGGDLHLTAIDFITIATTGNCSSFGSLASPGRGNLTGCASPTRAIFGGGYTPSPADETNTIEFVTIASTGNATNFGDLTSARFDPAACSSSTRGVFAGGREPAEVVTIDYVTIASTGDATDFGDLTQARSAAAGMSNSIRGVFAGGADHPLYYNTIDYITIATTGNAQDFGDTIAARSQSFGCSDSHGGIS